MWRGDMRLGLRILCSTGDRATSKACRLTASVYMRETWGCWMCPRRKGEPVGVLHPGVLAGEQPLGLQTNSTHLFS